MGGKLWAILDSGSVISSVDCFTLSNISEYTKVLKHPRPEVNPEKAQSKYRRSFCWIRGKLF